MEQAAEAAGASVKSTLKALDRLEPRGGCAAAAAKLAADRSLDIFIREKALHHVAATPPTLRAAARYTGRPSLTAAGSGSAAWPGRRQLSQITRRDMAKVADSNTADRRRQITTSAACAPAFLRRLVNDDTNVIRSDVAAHRRSPPDTLAVLAADAHSRVRIAAAHNPNTPPALLSGLAQDPSGPARRAVADNPSSTPETLAGLAAASGSGHAGNDLRARLAANPSRPTGLLERLSGSGGDRTR